MPPTANPINPYASPATESRRIAGIVRTFQVGSQEINTLVVEASLLRGIGTHVIDAADQSGPVHRGPCRFAVGNQERHEIQIEVDDVGRANVYIDGTLLEANLFASLRRVIFSLVTGFVIGVFALVSVFLYFWN